MENSLIDLIFLSEKRKKVLLLLFEGPKDINTIKKTLKASATSVQPQVKMLREKHLVVQDKEFYRLSEIGKIITEKMKPLLDTLSVLEENIDYWADRDMSKIPSFLLNRIGELGHCITIEPQLEHLFEMIPEYAKNAEEAKTLEALVSYFHPLFPSFYLGLAKKGTAVSLILPESILKRWIEDDYREQTRQFLKMENTKLLACKDCEKTPTIIAADNFMGIALFPKDAVFDRKYLINFEPGALSWGKELFEYYKNLSEQTTEINDLNNAAGNRHM
ncbi:MULTISPECIES: winged helix-turn-helix domain-containing protein [unclassified Methanosarcina]|uniref:helix-turn-helix transcriptional regulator n=1 Tax=unclassified Methanosarcina TaxID=2644672 RepID=UPI00061607CD|nr:MULTISPECIES: winged helix-turn-helix domain-containing protein [unclassified Methanosarcina]AKB18540.1 Transcriptional regulator, ArsR family [Methanosarcina sp. WWM596]AKB21895.1 Transcriptional regulator, ArsR family [Methanosarcina sp. WH1]